MNLRGFLTYCAILLGLGLAVGTSFMLGVQHLAEPIAERLFRSAHVPVHRPVFPPATVQLLSHYAGIIGFLWVMAEGARQG
jgi:hypothetical protein